MCEKPFTHNRAFHDIETNFIYHDDVVKIIPKILNKKGIINIGGKKQTVYNFVKQFNYKIKKGYARKILGPKHPLNPSINIARLKQKMIVLRGHYNLKKLNMI